MKTCPQCGEQNSNWARFCQACAALFAEAPTGPREERKIVTVLFCDLVGFTARSDEADPEDVRARLRPYHARLRTEIERFGGTVEKFIGDAVMAVFGAPVAHEDDAERAVRSALRIIDAIEDLNQEDPELGLEVRIGINTGEGVVTLGARPDQGEAIVTGDVVNTASRLQATASVNGVAVGEATYAATKDIFDYEALGTVALKGKAQPVPTFVAKAARARFGTDLAPRLTTPLVGRKLEQTLLTGIFERSVRDQSTQLVTIVGEPGVGKSRLVAELGAFIDALPDPVRWRQGRCLPYGDAVTFWALGEIVKAEAGILETDSPGLASSKIDAAVPPTHPDAPWLRRRLRPLVGLEAPEAAREENFAAWRAFLESLAEDGPSVFVFEDLHWADDALLAFLEHLADYAEGVPMLLIGTARPELSEKAPAFAQAARNSHRIELSPLNEQEMAQLVSNLLERAVLPAEVQEAILVRSGGNPLYAEEFVRLLKDRGVLTKHGATWTIDRTAEIPVPSGVHGLIAARLDTLAPERKRLLQDAAVVGKVFWAGAVAEMGEQDLNEVAKALHELSRNELVRPARVPSMEGQAEFAFFHALVRDVCYAQIPRASRAERHRRAAAWIEGVAGERLEDHAEILAAHYTTALDLAAAAKEPHTGELQDRALRYLTLAGDRAMGIDVEAAERHYRRALAMTTDNYPGRSKLLARHAEALRQRGRLPESARAFEEAIEGFRARGDVRAMAVAMDGYGNVLWRLGDARQFALSAEVLAALEPLGPSPELVQALAGESGGRYVANENHVAIALADRAISLADQLELPVPARALGFRGAARAFLGDAEGVDDIRQALKAATAQGLGREVAVLRGNLAEVLGMIEGPRAWLATDREGAAFAERRGIEEFVLGLTTGTIQALVALGSYDEAFALAEEIAGRLEEAEDVWDLVTLRSLQARVLTRRGRHAEAAPLAEWAAEHARVMKQPDSIAEAFPVAAAVRLAVGDFAGAAALLSELEETTRLRHGMDVWALPDAVRIALAAGDAEVATRLRDGLDPKYALHQHALTTARALLAERRGDQAGAEKLYSEAAERWRTFEMPWERGQALLGQSRCLLALGRSIECAPRLRQAREIFASLGAKPVLAETEALLERASTLTS